MKCPTLLLVAALSFIRPPELPPPDGSEYMAAAVRFSGYPTIDLPRIEWADPADLDRRQCLPRRRCFTAGLYFDGVIFLRRGLRQPELGATLVHEMTHHLQSGRHLDICKAEPEARMVEGAYIEIVQRRPAQLAWEPSLYGC